MQHRTPDGVSSVSIIHGIRPSGSKICLAIRLPHEVEKNDMNHMIEPVWQ